MSPSTLTIAAIASIGALDLSSVPAAAQATPLSENPAHTQAVTASHTETEISIEPDQFNATGIPGLAFTARGAGAEALSISEDGSVFTVRGADGTVVAQSTDPVLQSGAGPVPAKFVAAGNTIVITPRDVRLTSRAACASSFWGNAIFNIGMSGVCAALSVGTVVGGVVCTAALVSANTQINWDSHC